jgi:hypothetical protein
VGSFHDSTGMITTTTTTLTNTSAVLVLEPISLKLEVFLVLLSSSRTTYVLSSLEQVLLQEQVLLNRKSFS